jgi:hypothetical protein
MKNFAVLGIVLLVAGVASAQSDDCATAVAIGDGTVSGDTTGFTGIDESSCALNDTVDGWYLYTATCTGNATASTCSQAAFDTTLSAFDSCGGTELGCNDDFSGCSGNTSQLSFPVSTGNSYLVRIAGYNGESGTFDLTMSCTPSVPADDCSTAETVTALPFSTSVDNSTFFASPPSPSCNSSAATTVQNDVWYTFTVQNTCDFTVTVNPDAGTGYDGVVGLWEGSCAALTEVACGDEPEPMVLDVFGAAAGTTYYLQVGDWGTSAGGGLTDIDIVEVVPGSCGVVPVELMSFSIE